MAGFTGSWVIDEGEDGVAGFDLAPDAAFSAADEVPITPLEEAALQVAACIRRGHRDAALSAAIDLVNAMGVEYNTHAYAQR